MALDDPKLATILGAELYQSLIDDIELLDVAGEPVDMDKIRAGELTPVFFGSALTNFGISAFLDSFIDMAPDPVHRMTSTKGAIQDDNFSGFVFKIQANMDPNHRDRIAFLRVVTGTFEKDMDATNIRSGKKLKLSRPQRLFAQDRETVEIAFPGDIIGLTNPGAFHLGDTISVNTKVRFDEVPEFVPEVFARLSNKDLSRLKHFEKGVIQLSQEGLIQLFWDIRSHVREPILGAIGKLQFEVVQHRLMAEYGVKTNMQILPYEIIRWLDGDQSKIDAVFFDENVLRLVDGNDAPVILVASEWTASYLAKKNPDVEFLSSPKVGFKALANNV